MEFIVEFEEEQREIPVTFENLTVIQGGGGGDPTLQEKTVEPQTHEVVIEPDINYQGLSKVTVNPIQTEELFITAGGEYLPPANKYFSKVTVNVTVGGDQPTLFTPALQITLDDRLIITDGNGDFPTYVIRVQGATTDFIFETNSKDINLKQVQGLTHTETQTITVYAKGENFLDSETVSTEWIFVASTLGLAYSLNSDGQGYTLTGIGVATATDIIIPDEHDGLPVTAIAGNAFYRGTLTSVVFGSNIKTVNSQAFYQNSALQRVQLNEGLETIGASAFNATAIIELVIPSTVQTLSASCFANISTFTSVTFRGTPTTLDRQTFVYNRYVFAINVPWSEGEIPNAAWGATQAVVNYNFVE